MTPLQKLPDNVGDLGKLIAAKGFEKLPKSNKLPNLVTLSLTQVAKISQITLQHQHRIFNLNPFFKKMGHPRPLFIYFHLFYKQLTVNECSIKVANDWI